MLGATMCAAQFLIRDNSCSNFSTLIGWMARNDDKAEFNEFELTARKSTLAIVCRHC